MLTGAARLQAVLELTDEELLTVLAADPLDVIGGDTELAPELPILLQLLGEAQERVGASVLRRWVRSATAPGGGRPLDLLLKRDFAAFEDALDDLSDKGFVIRNT